MFDPRQDVISITILICSPPIAILPSLSYLMPHRRCYCHC